MAGLVHLKGLALEVGDDWVGNRDSGRTERTGVVI